MRTEEQRLEEARREIGSADLRQCPDRPAQVLRPATVASLERGGVVRAAYRGRAGAEALL